MTALKETATTPLTEVILRRGVAAFPRAGTVHLPKDVVTIELTKDST